MSMSNPKLLEQVNENVERYTYKYENADEKTILTHILDMVQQGFKYKKDEDYEYGRHIVKLMFWKNIPNIKDNTLKKFTIRAYIAATYSYTQEVRTFEYGKEVEALKHSIEMVLDGFKITEVSGEYDRWGKYFGKRTFVRETEKHYENSMD